MKDGPKGDIMRTIEKIIEFICIVLGLGFVIVFIQTQDSTWLMFSMILLILAVYYNKTMVDITLKFVKHNQTENEELRAEHYPDVVDALYVALEYWIPENRVDGEHPTEVRMYKKAKAAIAKARKLTGGESDEN